MLINSPMNKTNQYWNGVNNILQGPTRWVPQESEGGHKDTVKSQDFSSQNFSRHCIIGYYYKHTSIYMALLIILRSRHQAIYI
jgi:hypothetical protein